MGTKNKRLDPSLLDTRTHRKVPIPSPEGGRNDTPFLWRTLPCPFSRGLKKISLRSECNNYCPAAQVVDMPKAKRSEGIHPGKSSL